MRLEHHLVGGYVRYISPHIIIIIIMHYTIPYSSIFVVYRAPTLYRQDIKMNMQHNEHIHEQLNSQ